MDTELTSIGYKVKTREELIQQVPAAFSGVAHPDRTERYSHFSTEAFLNAFEKLGWIPYSAKQHGANPYSRHIIRLNNPDMGMIPINGDKIRPQLMLDNSHDGYTPGQIHLGLFRLICENGLVIAIPGLSNTVKFRHVGVNQKELIQMIAETAEQYRKIGDHVSDMQEIKMMEDQKVQFAMSALALRDPHRFLTKDKKVDEAAINAALQIEDIYEPVRPQDDSNNLWTVFNVVQERTVNGLYESKSKSGRKANPRSITNAARHLEYNQKLWTLAEEYMPVNEAKTYLYTTAKNEEKKVTIVSDLGNGRTQVKDVKANRVFTVASDKLFEYSNI